MTDPMKQDAIVGSAVDDMPQSLTVRALKARCLIAVLVAVAIEMVSRLLEASGEIPLVVTESITVGALVLICAGVFPLMFHVSRPGLMAAVIVPATLFLLIRPVYGVYETLGLPDGGARFNTIGIGLGPNAVINIFDGLGFGGWFFALFLLMFELLDAKHGIASRDAALREERVARAETEGLYRELVENASEIICRLDAMGNFEYVSPSVTRVLGFDPEQLIGTDSFALVEGEQRFKLKEFYRARVRGEIADPYTEFSVARKDGSFARLGQTAAILRDEQGITGYLSVTRDITAEYEAEQAQRESEERYRILTDAMGVVHWEASLPSWDFVYISPRAVALLGYAIEEWHTHGFWADKLHPDDREEAVRFCMQQTEVALDHEFQYRMISKTGEVVWIRDYVQVILEDGEAVGLRGFFVDITALKSAEAEKQIVERMRQQHERLESLGLLAGSIAHDFNNLLVSLIGHAELALMADDNGKRLERHLTTILEIGRQVADLCEQLLAYSGKGELRLRDIDVNDVAREVVRLTTPPDRSEDLLKFELAEALPTIVADTAQVRQVVMNLLSNALDATVDGGEIVVTTARKTCNAEFIRKASEAAVAEPGEFVVLEVRDSGCGMSQDDLAHVLEPFFTTKKEGTGLGLAGTDGILRRHGGFMRLESQEGVGTLIQAYFPLDATTPEAVDGQRCITRGGHTPSRVLVVDDDPAVLLSTRLLLENKGLEVLTAASGSEGIACFDENAQAIDAVLMDMAMPEMTGDKAARAIHEIDAGVPIILISALDPRDLKRDYATEEFAGFVMKPFDFQDIARELEIAEQS